MNDFQNFLRFFFLFSCLEIKRHETSEETAIISNSLLITFFSYCRANYFSVQRFFSLSLFFHTRFCHKNVFDLIQITIYSSIRCLFLVSMHVFFFSFSWSKINFFFDFFWFLVLANNWQRHFTLKPIDLVTRIRVTFSAYKSKAINKQNKKRILSIASTVEMKYKNEKKVNIKRRNKKQTEFICENYNWIERDMKVYSHQ